MRIEDPAIQRQRLRLALRQARMQADLTQRETADALNWSPSKLLRTAPYADIVPSEFPQYLQFERAAARIRTFEPLIIPGLLQTEKYARAVLEACGHAGTSLERGLAGQAERTARLLRDDAPAMHFILDEAAIHRAVGDDFVMQGQLNWLAELAERPTISIGVVSLPESDRPDVERLSILEFEGEPPTYAVYSDGPDGPMLDTTDFAGAERHLDLFSQLAEMASPKEGLDRRFLPVAA